MSTSWKLTTFASKNIIEDALETYSAQADWDPEVVVTGFEVSADRPEEWRLDAYLPREPDEADRQAILGLFAQSAPTLDAEELPDADWVTQSQLGVEPIQAGQFYVHTPDFEPSDDPAICSLVIPASQAFGTGQHETTAGCLELLSVMQNSGVASRNFADIGTGTGLLAFAGLRLWPDATAIASDIDPICKEVIERNAADNEVEIGQESGEMALVIADGMDDPLLQARRPYDLLIANILAQPLIDLAPVFSECVTPDGSVLLAGLLETQEREVTKAYERFGFNVVERLIKGDWSILWIRRYIDFLCREG